jgi:hypothetical protein
MRAQHAQGAISQGKAALPELQYHTVRPVECTLLTGDRSISIARVEVDAHAYAFTQRLLDEGKTIKNNSSIQQNNK